MARAALLQSEDPLVKAYTACILANIAFLAPGQEKVLEAHGVKPLVKLLKAKDADKKITLHSTAAVQNLTYKNTACCQQVLEEGGESTLKKLLKVRPRRRHCVGGKLPLLLLPPLLPLLLLLLLQLPRLLPRLRGCRAAAAARVPRCHAECARTCVGSRAPMLLPLPPLSPAAQVGGRAAVCGWRSGQPAAVPEGRR